MKSVLLSRRDLDFLLFEWLRVDELTKRERFTEHSREAPSDTIPPGTRRLARVPRLPAHASPTRRTDPTLGAVLDPRIVIKKHRSSLSGNTVQPHACVGGITDHFFTYRATGDIAPR